MKVLITSDIHINDFRSFNIHSDPLFRLHQFEKLSHRLVQIIQNENIGALCIAGDFLHVASPRPYIVNAAGRFLKNIAKVCPIFVTHGQHDYDSRTVMSEDNSLLSLYNNIDNVTYLHKDSVDLGGKQFYFQGWTPEQDFSSIVNGKYDVLIGHATINTATMNDYGTEATGPDYDHDKFQICFMGDIHYPQVKGNQVIPGVPIQNNFGDSSDNSVIILDTDTLKWKRVATETLEFRFLKFLTTDKVSDDPYIITKPRNSSKLAIQKDQLNKSVDIVQVIDKYVNDEKLNGIHELCMSSISKLEPDEIDLNYTIQSIELINFRSVEHLMWTPTLGVTLILGSNGTGKSSLVDGIRFALLGSNAVRDFVRLKQSEMSATICLTYGGIEYKIIRGFNKKSGYTRFFTFGKEIEFENKRAADDRIKRDLSFLNLYYSLHRDQDTPRFLASQSYGERVDLMSKVIGLSLVNKLKIAGEGIKSPLSFDHTSLSNEKSSLDHFLSSIANLDLESDSTDYTMSIKKCEDSISKLNNLDGLCNTLDSYVIDLEKNNYALAQYSSYDFSSSMECDQSSIQKLEKNLSSLNVVKLGIESEVRDLQVNLIRSKSMIGEINRKVEAIDEKKNKVKAKICFTCSQTIDRDLTLKLISNIEKEREAVTSNLEGLKDTIEDLEKRIESKSVELSSKTREIDGAKSEYEIKYREYRIKEDLKNAYEKFQKIKDKVIASEKLVNDTESKLKKFFVAIGNQLNIVLNNKPDVLFHIDKLRNDLAGYKQKQSSQITLKNLRSEITSKKEKVVSVTQQLKDISIKLEQCDKYIQLMSASGSVTRSVLTTVSDNLSDDKIKVIAFKTLQNGETRPDFNLYLKVADEFINYELLSGGQKNVCDIFILRHLIDLAGGAGSLIFDETFSQVDTANLEYTVDILKHMKVNHIMIISHHENFPHYDAMLSTNFNTVTGVTTYNLPR